MKPNSHKADALYAVWFQKFLTSAPSHFLKHGYETGQGSGMAASVEAIKAFIDRISPDDVILDAGAGATTWMFNELLKNEITTIDFDKAYLGVVATIVNIHGSRSCNARFEPGFPACDYCFFDYAHTQTRAEFLPLVAKAAVKGVYVDDYDYREGSRDYKAKVDRFAAENGYKIQFCEPATDSYGRAGCWLLHT